MARPTAGKNPTKMSQSSLGAKKYLSQTDVPGMSLEHATRVPRAIVDEHAGRPTRPLDVAHAMKVQPSSGPFRTICGASIAYGLTEGGYNADTITVTDLGRRVVDKPIDDPDGLAARREAVLKPRVIREFLQKYDGAKMPREDVALNVLDGLNVPKDSLSRAWGLISDAARQVRFLKDINGVQYVDLKNTPMPTAKQDEQPNADDNASFADLPEPQASGPRATAPPPPSTTASEKGPDLRDTRVFVTHGKNRELNSPAEGTS